MFKKKQYKHGDVVSTKKFAFLPTKYLDEKEELQTIWFRFYYEKKLYQEIPFLGSFWYVFRSLNPIREPPKLQLIKNESHEE